MKKVLIALSCIVFLVLILFSMVTHIPQYEPEDGVWLCEELQMQLDYSGHSETYFVKNGKKILCGCGSDRSVKAIEISCQEFNNPDYYAGELIFRAEIRKLTDETMLVYEPKTDREFIFIRVN